MKEVVTLVAHYPARKQRTVEIEYRRAEHWLGEHAEHRGRTLTAYDVYVDGKHVGKITAERQSTDRHYGRIRVPGRGRVAWQWQKQDYKKGERMRSAPGLYCSTRASAVAEMMGYGYARKEA